MRPAPRGALEGAAVFAAEFTHAGGTRGRLIARDLDRPYAAAPPA